MKTIKFLLTTILVLLAFSSFSQNLTWTNITDKFNLPEGITVFETQRESPALKAWYMDVDMKAPDLVAKAALQSPQNLPSHVQNLKALAAINGGYFGGSTSYSTVVSEGMVLAQNVGALSRNGQSYPVIRGFLGIDSDHKSSVNWIYHHGPLVNEIFAYEGPMPYIANDKQPQTKPITSAGIALENIQEGIGGGPVLLKNGEIAVTYNEEIFWGSGVGLSNKDPRTVIGYTADKHLILFVADGRQGNTSLGVDLNELAEIMQELGCYEAINFDGGGSSQMAIGNEYVNNPNEHRPVPSVFAIFHKDSLETDPTTGFEEIWDTDSEGIIKEGEGWFETANSGFWGTSKALLAPKGDGNQSITYPITAPADVYSEVFAWWVNHSNRCKDTPFIIKHKHGIDTVRTNQTINGSSWQKIGKYVFAGDGSDYLKITNGATAGDYVVADGIKITSDYEEPVVTSTPDAYSKLENIRIYPNPCKEKFYIHLPKSTSGTSTIEIFNLHGKKVFQKLTSFNKTTQQINIPSSLQGFYTLTIKKGSNFLSTKLVVE